MKTRQLSVYVLAIFVILLIGKEGHAVSWNPFHWASYGACMAAFGTERQNGYDYCSCVHMKEREDEYCTCRHIDGNSKATCNASAGTSYAGDLPVIVNFNGFVSPLNDPNLCIHKEKLEWMNGDRLHLWTCDAGSVDQKAWSYDSQTGLIHGFRNSQMCWHKKRGDWHLGQSIHLWDCKPGSLAQKTWDVDASTGQIRAREKPSLCAAFGASKQRAELVLVPCGEGNVFQKLMLLVPITTRPGILAPNTGPAKKGQ